MLEVCLVAVATLWGRSELEWIGLVALFYLVSHLFVSFVWPSLRNCVCVIWTDLVAGARTIKRDLKQLRDES